MLTPDQFYQHTDARRAEWDGKGVASPRDLECPECGALTSDPDRHIAWHKREASRIVAAVVAASAHGV
jgi:hypothetical protein